MVFCPRATMAYAGILAILSLGQYCGRHAGLYTDPTGFRPTMIPLRLRVCLLHGPYVSLLHMRSGNIYRNPSDTSPHRRFPPSILCPPDPKTRRTCSSVCRALRLRLRRSRCRTESSEPVLCYTNSVVRRGFRRDGDCCAYVGLRRLHLSVGRVADRLADQSGFGALSLADFARAFCYRPYMHACPLHALAAAEGITPSRQRPFFSAPDLVSVLELGLELARLGLQ